MLDNKSIAYLEAGGKNSSKQEMQDNHRWHAFTLDHRFITVVVIMLRYSILFCLLPIKTFSFTYMSLHSMEIVGSRLGEPKKII